MKNEKNKVWRNHKWVKGMICMVAGALFLGGWGIAENSNKVVANAAANSAVEVTQSTVSNQLTTNALAVKKVVVAKTKSKKYVPISKGLKTSKSTKDKTVSKKQKAALDKMVKKWKAKKYTDASLKTAIENYLLDQKVSFREVNVTSKGKALYAKIPKAEIEEGGNPYSFFGTYCTGKKNPGGTNKTVCYNWSVFVF